MRQDVTWLLSGELMEWAMWPQPVNGGSPSQLTDFRLEGATQLYLMVIGWSPDGNALGIGLRNSRSDAILLRQQAK